MVFLCCVLFVSGCGLTQRDSGYRRGSLTDLEPEVVEAMVNRDRESWTKFAHSVHDSVEATLKAVEAKNPTQVFDVAGTIDQACENCHQKFRYKGK
jgi:cytochrome c556